MPNRGISEAVIKRLPRYYRYLNDLSEEGVERISSSELSKIMKVTASQIRQDLNHFGGFDKAQSMVIIGAGRLGQALANYVRFEKRGFRVIGVFDCNPQLIGQTVRQCTIQSTDELADFLDTHDVDIATLAIPRKDAPDMARLVVAHGVHAIWNFTPVDLNLHLPEDVVVENVHLSESLMKLSCDLQHIRQKDK